MFIKFDDAVSDFGICKPYIHTIEYQLVRSWQGCLALTLSGDPIEEDDEKPLNNEIIRLQWIHWAYFAIDILFKELEHNGFDRERMENAKKIHRKFVEHFDELPYDKYWENNESKFMV